MSDANVVTIQLLDRSFQLKCSPEKVDQLRAAGAYLANKMEQLHKNVNALGYERTAVMAAMDISFELMNLRDEIETSNHKANECIKNLQDKINATMESAEIRLPKSPSGEQQSLDM